MMGLTSSTTLTVVSGGSSAGDGDSTISANISEL